MESSCDDVLAGLEFGEAVLPLGVGAGLHARTPASEAVLSDQCLELHGNALDGVSVLPGHCAGDDRLGHQLHDHLCGGLRGAAAGGCCEEVIKSVLREVTWLHRPGWNSGERDPVEFKMPIVVGEYGVLTANLHESAVDGLVGYAVDHGSANRSGRRVRSDLSG